MECGKVFNRSNPSVTTECPECGGSDIEVANNKKNEIDVSEIVRRYKEECRKYDLDPKDEQNYIEFMEDSYPALKGNLKIQREVIERVNIKKNAVSAEKLAEEIIDAVNPSDLTESKCVSWAQANGYTKAEGQNAWVIIYREMKSMNKKNAKYKGYIIQDDGNGYDIVDEIEGDFIEGGFASIQEAKKFIDSNKSKKNTREPYKYRSGDEKVNKGKSAYGSKQKEKPIQNNPARAW